MAKVAVKSKKHAKPAKGKKHHRGVLDLPKAVEAQMAEGRAERESVPLEAHGEWAAFDGRPDPIAILEEQNATRVPELVPIRHGRMIVSPHWQRCGRRPRQAVACLRESALVGRNVPDCRMHAVLWAAVQRNVDVMT